MRTPVVIGARLPILEQLRNISFTIFVHFNCGDWRRRGPFLRVTW